VCAVISFLLRRDNEQHLTNIQEQTREPGPVASHTFSQFVCIAGLHRDAADNGIGSVQDGNNGIPCRRSDTTSVGLLQDFPESNRGEYERPIGQKLADGGSA
jgi:hypothetical protein